MCKVDTTVSVALAISKERLEAASRAVEALGFAIGQAADSPPKENLVHVPGAKFPLAWDKEYYVVGVTQKNEEARCPACDDGWVWLEYDGDHHKHCCPRCRGKGREWVAKDKKHVVDTYKLYMVRYEKNNGCCYIELNGVAGGRIVMAANSEMAYRENCYDGNKYLYQTREEAQAEADKLNAEMGGKAE
jgi:endogenous inhibitor of DNA gyrase (YacG/DUF329 family)